MMNITLLLIGFCVFSGATAQIALKRGIQLLGVSSLFPPSPAMFKALTTPLVLLGITLYVLNFLSWLMVLSRVDLTFAYPLLSLAVLVVAFISWGLGWEAFSLQRLIGTILVLFGSWMILRT